MVIYRTARIARAARFQRSTPGRENPGRPSLFTQNSLGPLGNGRWAESSFCVGSQSIPYSTLHREAELPLSAMASAGRAEAAPD